MLKRVDSKVSLALKLKLNSGWVLFGLQMQSNKTFLVPPNLCMKGRLSYAKPLI